MGIMGKVSGIKRSLWVVEQAAQVYRADTYPKAAINGWTYLSTIFRLLRIGN